MADQRADGCHCSAGAVSGASGPSVTTGTRRPPIAFHPLPLDPHAAMAAFLPLELQILRNPHYPNATQKRLIFGRSAVATPIPGVNCRDFLLFGFWIRSVVL